MLGAGASTKATTPKADRRKLTEQITCFSELVVFKSNSAQK